MFLVKNLILRIYRHKDISRRGMKNLFVFLSCPTAFGMDQVGRFWWISWETTQWEVSVDTDSIRMSARNERSKLDSYFDNGCIFHLFFFFYFSSTWNFIDHLFVKKKRTNFYKLVTFLNISNGVIIIVWFVFNFYDRDKRQDDVGDSWMIGWLVDDVGMMQKEAVVA